MKLNLTDLLDISSETNMLKVIGDSGDKVEVTGFNKLTAGSVANGLLMMFILTLVPPLHNYG